MIFLIVLGTVIAIAAVVLLRQWWIGFTPDDGGLGHATAHLIEDAERREARWR